MMGSTYFYPCSNCDGDFSLTSSSTSSVSVTISNVTEYSSSYTTGSIGTSVILVTSPLDVGSRVATYTASLISYTTTRYTSKSTYLAGVNTTYTFSGLSLTEGTTYYVYLCHESGSTTSTRYYMRMATNYLSFTVKSKPTISISGTQHYQGYSYGYATLTATASDATSYQWQYSSDGSSWSNFGSSSTSARYERSNISSYTSHTSYIRCIATNSAGSTTSNTLSYSWYTVYPSASASKSQSGRTFSLYGSYSDATSYGWQYSSNGSSWSSYSSSSSTSYTFSGYQAGTMYFRFWAYNPNGTDYSSTLTCSVEGVTPTVSITSSASDRTITVTKTSANATSYQWQYSDDNSTWTNYSTSTSTSTTYTVPESFTGTKYFRVIATNDYTSTTSNTTSHSFTPPMVKEIDIHDQSFIRRQETVISNHDMGLLGRL